MKDLHSQYTINEFFEEFKKLPNSYKIEQVHQLLNNPHATARHKVNIHFKNLKLIIMTSAVIISITTIMFYSPTVKQVKMDLSSGKVQNPVEYYEVKKGKPTYGKISNNANSESGVNLSQGMETIGVNENFGAEDSLSIFFNNAENQLNTTNAEQESAKNENNGNPSGAGNNLKKEKPFIEVPVLNLSKSEMENLGFVFYKDSVVFTFKDKCNKYIGAIENFTFDFKQDSAILIDEQYLKLEEYQELKSKGKVNPFLVKRAYSSTYVCGKISLKDKNQILIRALNNRNVSEFSEQIWNYIEDKKDGYYPEMKFEDINLNLLVPVKCSSGDSELEQMFSKHVFWIYPNEELFRRLPERLSNDLRKEFNLLKSENLAFGKVASSCTYYEACKSTLQLENLKIYPNPAKYSVTIDFSLDKEVEGSIAIFNIAGVKLKNLVSGTAFSSGHNSFEMDLSGIAPGIYVIAINTDKGFKTQRLIVSQ